MTITQIIVKLAPHREMTRDTLYSYLRKLHIRPLGTLRTRPQRYPDDAPSRILKALGVVTKSRNGRTRRAA